MINLPLYLLCGCMHASVWVLERSHTHIFLNGLNFVGANITYILVNILYYVCLQKLLILQTDSTSSDLSLLSS